MSTYTIGNRQAAMENLVRAYALAIPWHALILILLCAPNDCQAQSGREMRSVVLRQSADRDAGRDGALRTASFSRNSSSTDVARIVRGSTLGCAIGLAAGAGIGNLLNSDAGDSWVGVTNEFIIGAAIGSTVGCPTGAYLANERRGNVVLSLAASSLLTVAAAKLAEKKPLLAITFPLFQMVSSTITIALTD